MSFKNQISFVWQDYGWYSSLPFDSFGQAHSNVTYFKPHWKKIEVIKKGNGWIIRYKERKNKNEN